MNLETWCTRVQCQMSVRGFLDASPQHGCLTCLRTRLFSAIKSSSREYDMYKSLSSELNSSHHWFVFIIKPWFLSTRCRCDHFINSNFVSGLDLKAIVQLPDGEDLNDWIAVHVVDFFNRINLIYGTVADFCTEEVR